MSSISVKEEREDAIPRLSVERPGRGGYRSFRKKYRKMKLQFDASMEEASIMFVAEHKAWDIVRRLKEQNDQLLDILLDINDSARMPVRHYELNSPLLSKLELNVSAEPRTNDKPTFTGLSLSSLSRQATHTPYSLPSPSILPADLCDFDKSPPPAYLTPTEEEAYLTAINSSLAAMPPTDNLPADVEIVQAILRPRDRTNPTEKDFAIDNPISVHNWLRKYQPRVFDAKDRDSERAKSPAVKSKKKDKTAKQDAVLDGLDEESARDLVPENGGNGSAKGKRKGEDDAYRPKGGHKRPAKRKRDVDDAEGKSGKKLKKGGTMDWEDDL